MSRPPLAVNPGKARLPGGLYALCDDGFLPEVPFLRKARGLAEGGAAVVQLRIKRATEREAVSLCVRAVAVCREAGALCLVNDRVDWALLSGADGVHLGEDDLPVAAARKLLGADRLVGRTVRSLAQIRVALREGADHVGLGPIFATRTKTVAHAALGVSTLARIARASPLPIVAIGGIGRANIAAVAGAGAHAAAVLSDWLSARSLAGLRARGRELRGAFFGPAGTGLESGPR